MLIGHEALRARDSEYVRVQVHEGGSGKGARVQALEVGRLGGRNARRTKRARGSKGTRLQGN